MSEDAPKEPLFYDEFFRKKPKKSSGEYKIVDSPCMLTPIADTHAHLDMLSDPALALARAGAHKVAFIETMVDPLGSEGLVVFEHLDEWIHQANIYIRNMCSRICGQGWNKVPVVRISVGVHPHVSKKFDDSSEKEFVGLLHDGRVSAVGEIGLDYHYDYSPRDIQKDVFKRQLEIAKTADLPVILHVREAFDDAYEIMQSVGWNDGGVLLHCYTSDADEIKRWVEKGCYIAFGGAFTFKKLVDVREAAKLVPRDRLLLETDAPFMTPEPFRGMECEPAHVIWTAERLYRELEICGSDESDADVICAAESSRGSDFVYSGESDDRKRAFMQQTYENALGLLNRAATPWQLGE